MFRAHLHLSPANSRLSAWFLAFCFRFSPWCFLSQILRGRATDRYKLQNVAEDGRTDLLESWNDRWDGDGFSYRLLTLLLGEKRHPFPRNVISLRRRGSGFRELQGDFLEIFSRTTSIFILWCSFNFVERNMCSDITVELKLNLVVFVVQLYVMTIMVRIRGIFLYRKIRSVLYFYKIL